MAVHVSHTAHEPVGGCARDQLLAGAPALLGREQQRPVLHEGARVHELGEVLPRGPAPVLVTTCDGLLPGGVEADLMPLANRAQVGPLALRLRLLGALGGGPGDRPRLQRRQQLALADGFTDGHGQLADDPVDVRHHLVLHLHRLEHHHRSPGSHLGVGPQRQRHHDRVERRQHRVSYGSAHLQIIPDGDPGRPRAIPRGSQPRLPRSRPATPRRGGWRASIPAMAAQPQPAAARRDSLKELLDAGTRLRALP